MRRFAIEFFDKENGSEPAKEFIFSLDKKMRTKVLFILDILADNGYELREPYSKHLEDGIFELRAKVGSDISRVFVLFLCRQPYRPHERLYQKNAKDS